MQLCWEWTISNSGAEQFTIVNCGKLHDSRAKHHEWHISKKWNTFEYVSLVQYSSRVQLCWVQTIQKSRGVQFSIVTCEHRKKMKHFLIHQANTVFYRHTTHFFVVYHKNEPTYRVSLVIMLVVAMNTSTVPWWLRHAML